MCDLRPIKHFVEKHAKVLSWIAVYFVVLVVLVINVVVYVVDPPITFTNSIAMIAVETFALLLLLAQIGIRLFLNYFNFFEDPMLKGLYMIL